MALNPDMIKYSYVEFRSKHVKAYRKRWLVLYRGSPNSPARLVKYGDESDFSRSPDGRRQYMISDVVEVERYQEKPKSIKVKFSPNEEVTDIVFTLDSDVSVQDWLHSIHKEMIRIADTFPVTVINGRDIDVVGEVDLYIHDGQITIFHRGVNRVTIPISSITDYKEEHDHLFWIQTGSDSPIGKVCLTFQSLLAYKILSKIHDHTRMSASSSVNQPVSSPYQPTRPNQYPLPPDYLPSISPGEQDAKKQRSKSLNTELLRPNRPSFRSQTNSAFQRWDSVQKEMEDIIDNPHPTDKSMQDSAQPRYLKMHTILPPLPPVHPNNFPEDFPPIPQRQKDIEYQKAGVPSLPFKDIQPFSKDMEQVQDRINRSSDSERGQRNSPGWEQGQGRRHSPGWEQGQGRRHSPGWEQSQGQRHSPGWEQGQVQRHSPRLEQGQGQRHSPGWEQGQDCHDPTVTSGWQNTNGQRSAAPISSCPSGQISQMAHDHIERNNSSSDVFNSQRRSGTARQNETSDTPTKPSVPSKPARHRVDQRPFPDHHIEPNEE